MESKYKRGIHMECKGEPVKDESVVNFGSEEENELTLVKSFEEETYKTFEKQDEKWKEAKVDARQHLSHREVHIEYRTELTRAISRYQAIEDWLMLVHCTTKGDENNRLCCLNQDILRIITEYAFDKAHGPVVGMIDHNMKQSFLHHSLYRQQQLLQAENSSPVQPFFVYIRQRPLLDFELRRGNYSVVDINTYSLDTRRYSTQYGSQAFSNLVGVHDGKLARNARFLEMKHKIFAVSEAFSAHISNDKVCTSTIEPLVAQVKKGLNATALFYGQTGTGKTYTMVGALKYIAKRFAGCQAALTFYEIRGRKSFDLLNERNLVYLRSDENEHVHVRGCKVVKFHNLAPKEFMHVLIKALSERSSKVTERNPVSSRSHAICTISVPSKSGTCTLRLVDLAGSERNYETSEFTAADHRESADINYALMALKNCFRAYNATTRDQNFYKKSLQSRAQYRASLLTRVLRECFVRENKHTTTVIATISPSPTDLEHTLNTLEHVTMMDPSLDELPMKKCVAVDVMIDGCARPNNPVDTWSHEELMAWLSHADGGKFSQLILPESMNGKGLLDLNVTSLTALCSGQLRDARQDDEGSAWVEEGEVTRGQQIIAKRLFALLRREQNASLLRMNKTHQTL